MMCFCLIIDMYVRSCSESRFSLQKEKQLVLSLYLNRNAPLHMILTHFISYIKYCTKIIDFTVEIVILYHYYVSGACSSQTQKVQFFGQ